MASINTMTNSSPRRYFNFFIYRYLRRYVNLLLLAVAEMCDECRRKLKTANQKNSKKSLSEPRLFRYRGTSSDKCPHFVVQKKFKKVKKKLVRALEI